MKDRLIPSRYVTYYFVCRECGKSDVGEFDKFTDPKNRDDIYCEECSLILADFGDDELPF